MSPSETFPELTVVGDEDRAERLARLLRACDVMGSLVRIVWPADGTSHDRLAVRWAAPSCRSSRTGTS
jgi:hypothetical protein